jgi:hypothetical protein
MKIATCARIGALAVLATLVLSGTGWAIVVPSEVGPLDFCPPAEYDDNFVEVRRGPEITPGDCAVNFAGLTGAAGDTWITRYDGDGVNNRFNGFNGICMSADVLISKYNNAKGGGLVALLNTAPGDKGLFLLLINNGNTDRLTLNTIDPNNGKIVQLASVPLGSAIVENAWYRLNLAVRAQSSADTLSVGATVRSHTPPSDPSDATVDGTIGDLLAFNGSLQGQGLEQSGYVGMAAWAKSAVVNTSITNFFATAPCID